MERAVILSPINHHALPVRQFGDIAGLQYCYANHLVGAAALLMPISVQYWLHRGVKSFSREVADQPEPIGWPLGPVIRGSPALHLMNSFNVDAAKKTINLRAVD